MSDRFSDWKPPKIKEGVPTQYSWVVQNKYGLKLGSRTGIRAFTYINANSAPILLNKNGWTGSHLLTFPSVKVGENTIVGPMSFVDQALPENGAPRGVQAKVVALQDDKHG